MPDPTQDLNATIASAVNARIEAEVMKALSGDETISHFVAAAMQQPVELTKNYRTEKVPFLRHVLTKAIQQATEQAVKKLIVEEVESIEAEVRKALRRDLATIASTLTKSLVDAAGTTYGVSVDLSLKMPQGDRG